MRKRYRYACFILLLVIIFSGFQNCSSSKESSSSSNSTASVTAITFSLPTKLDGLCTGSPSIPLNDPALATMTFGIIVNGEAQQIIRLSTNGADKKTEVLSIEAGTHTLASLVTVTCGSPFPSTIFFRQRDDEQITVPIEGLTYIPEGIEHLY